MNKEDVSVLKKESDLWKKCKNFLGMELRVDQRVERVVCALFGIVFIIFSCMLVWIMMQDINGINSTITSGVVVEKTNYVTSNKFWRGDDVFSITYEGKNADGVQERRTDRVTQYTYSQYEVGDTFERDGNVMKKTLWG